MTPTSQSGFAGDTLPFTWTITVTESVFEENFDVAGVITIVNPAPMDMTVALADVLSDATNAVIGSCTNGGYEDLLGSALVLRADRSRVDIDYSTCVECGQCIDACYKGFIVPKVPVSSNQ